METGDNKHNLIYREENVQPEVWAQSHLSIQITNGSLAWCITDLTTDLVLEVGKTKRTPSRQLTAFVKESMAEAISQNGPFHSVSWSLKGTNSVLVPAGLFNEQQKHQLYNFHFGDTEKDLLHIALSTGEIILIQEHDRDVESIILNRFPHASYFFNAAALIESMMKRSRIHKNPQVLMDVEVGFVELIITQNGELIIHTKFEWANAEDVLFHFAHTCDQLNLDIQVADVLLTGQVDMGGDIYTLLNNYVNNLRLHFGFTFSKMARSLSSVKKQEFMTLLNQYACVS